ncbi:MAG: ABC transporter permease [Nitrososphaerales archaeon]|nr:ABC transporter permease [Nitrososphaerales archaeon]
MSSEEEGWAKALYRLFMRAVPSLIALLLGLLAGAVLILLAGYSPILVFSAMINGAFGTNDGQSYLLTYMATLILAALAFLLPGKAGIWNVGAQGQIYFGGIFAAMVALFIPLPLVLWPLVAFIVAGLSGAMWAFIPGVLEPYRKASAIVTTIMMNYIAQATASYLLFNYIGRLIPQTLVSNQTPRFSTVVALPKIPGYSASIMIFISIFAAFACWYFLQRTSLGYKIRATGSGPMSAQAKGINPKKMQVIAMAIGGLIAGIAGAGDVLSRGNYVDQFAEGWFGGEGFAGIAVALVAANNPIGSIFSAVLFGVMVAGAPSIQLQGLPRELVWAMQGLIILFTAMPYLSRAILKRTGKKKWT